MNPIKIPCNQCVNNHHTACTADRLESNGYIDNGKMHCSCSYDGHKGEENPRAIPKVKSMFSKTPKDIDDPVPTREVIVEKDLEVVED